MQPKASRARVWEAADRILRSGRRPTVEAVRELLGGGSPNSVTAYIGDWYADLGQRLASAEPDVPGIPPQAVALMTQLWHLAGREAHRALSGNHPHAAHVQMLTAERSALAAETTALKLLNEELHRHRATAEQALAEARALLLRREAALEDERARAAEVERTLAHARMELALLTERVRIRADAGATRTSPTRSPASRSRTAKRTRD